MELIVGGKYKVNAVGTNDKEVWTITSISENRRGVTEVTAKGSKTQHQRTFLTENFVEMEKKMSKTIISESVELVGVVDGFELWREHTTHWPAQAKRGRKKKVQEAA